MEYLVDWLYELHGRSGVGMAGYAPLSYTTLEAWARVRDIGELHPLEVEALLLLDQALLLDNETSEEDQVILPQAKPSWPSKKE